jgi:hypothetical protein
MSSTNRFHIQCGYLPSTKSCRYHPIQNVRILQTNEECKIKIYSDNEIIKEYNDKIQYTIEMKQDNDYKINLLINDNIIKQQSTLFHIDIYLENYKESDIILTRTFIYDS